MTADKAPDLENGFLVLGATAENSWSTEILCAASVTGPDGTHTHYLSRECRSEDIAFRAGSAAGRIFQAGRSWEFVMAVLDGRPMQMTNGDIAFLPVNAGRDEPAFGCIIKPTAMDPGFTAEIHCPLRDITVLPLGEVLEGLRQRRLPVRNLFMRIDFDLAGKACEIFCPCRYVNFGNGAFAANAYVQPISGYVLLPPVEGDAQIGYVACNLAVDGSSVIEFCGKRYQNVFAWLGQNLDGGGDTGTIRELSRNFPVFATVHDRITPLQGSCRFFTYPESGT